MILTLPRWALSDSLLDDGKWPLETERLYSDSDLVPGCSDAQSLLKSIPVSYLTSSEDLGQWTLKLHQLSKRGLALKNKDRGSCWVSNNASLCLLILPKRCSDHLQTDSSTNLSGSFCLVNSVLVFRPLDAAVSHRCCWRSFLLHSSDKLSGLSASSCQRCDLHVHSEISFFSPALELSISINFNHCYLKRKCYTAINGSNNCAQCAIWLAVTAPVNSMITAVARTGKSRCYHSKVISINSVNLRLSRAESHRPELLSVTYCIAARQLITVQQSTLAVKQCTTLWRTDWHHVIFCNHAYTGGFCFRSWGIFLAGMLI